MRKAQIAVSYLRLSLHQLHAKQGLMSEGYRRAAARTGPPKKREEAERWQIRAVHGLLEEPALLYNVVL